MCSSPTCPRQLDNTCKGLQIYRSLKLRRHSRNLMGKGGFVVAPVHKQRQGRPRQVSLGTNQGEHRSAAMWLLFRHSRQPALRHQALGRERGRAVTTSNCPRETQRHHVAAITSYGRRETRGRHIEEITSYGRRETRRRHIEEITSYGRRETQGRHIEVITSYGRSETRARHIKEITSYGPRARLGRHREVITSHRQTVPQ